jgi:endo-1,4-beta-mannosidase
MVQPFILGINYFPRRKAMYWWADFDAGEVQEEFSLIREIGMTLVRIFLLWEDFQPSPDQVSISSSEKLVKVCDIASAEHLQVDVNFFTGHMSGPSWVPPWMLHGDKPRYIRQVISGGKIVDRGYLKQFSDATVIEAEKLQLSEVVKLLKDHPAVWCWNLGNEPDLFALPADDITGEKWASELVATIRELDPAHPITCGLHIARLLYNIGLRIDQIFSKTDFAVMHSYPIYLSELTGDPLDPDFVPFTCALTTALSGKPVMMEEFGGCTAPPGKDSFTWEWIGYGSETKQFMASEEALAGYISAVLPRLVDAGVSGALSWCFADYHPSIWDRQPFVESRHERFFGIVRPDGSLKPHAQVIRDFAATNPMVMPAKRKITLPYQSSEYYHYYLEKFMDLYEVWKGKTIP